MCASFFFAFFWVLAKGPVGKPASPLFFFSRRVCLCPGIKFLGCNFWPGLSFFATSINCREDFLAFVVLRFCGASLSPPLNEGLALWE